LKHYTLAHSAFFEASLHDWPTPALEWLAEGLPKLSELVPHNDSGMLLKDSPLWLEIQHEAIDEMLPDWCFNCGYIDGWIIGGKLRDGCHRCVNQIDPNSDGYMRALMRICLTLTSIDGLHYTEQLADYLFLCHIKWREQSVHEHILPPPERAEAQLKLDNPIITYNPGPIESVTPVRRSLLDKLKP